jgi:hypothetical protein
VDLEEVHSDPLIPCYVTKELNNVIATVALPVLLFEICRLFLKEKAMDKLSKI